MNRVDNQQIAIIGIACRFPGAPDKETFWENLQQGRCTIETLTPEQLSSSDESPKRYRRNGYIACAPVLADYDRFDARFFGISDSEARLMDPQQRLMLEVGYQALEDAGYTQGAQRCITGVYACGGGATTSYLYQYQPHFRALDDGTASAVHLGNDKDFLATRLAFKLNLSGPAMTVQTACSSAFAALHQARSALILGEVDMAMVAASCVRLPHHLGYHPDDHPILSKDGRCCPFSSQASGTVFGSGVGVVVLKMLTEAVRDKDQIYAVLHATAMNNDGANKIGYSASSVRGQAAAMSRSLAIAQMDGQTLGYIECHGTATHLGDPLEIKALAQAMGTVAAQEKCRIGSVKGNIGHLEQAAGIASLIKVALMLRHGSFVPTINCDPENEKLNLAQTPFMLSRETSAWPSIEREGHILPRYAGINCLGIGGSNIFAVLSDFTPHNDGEDAHATDEKSLFCLSAKTPSQLCEYLHAYQRWLTTHPQTDIVALCRSNNLSRSQHKIRLAGVVDRHTLGNFIQTSMLTCEQSAARATYLNKRYYLCQVENMVATAAVAPFLSDPQWRTLARVYQQVCGFGISFVAENRKFQRLMPQFQTLGFELGLLHQLQAWGVGFERVVGTGFGRFVAQASQKGEQSLQAAITEMAARWQAEEQGGAGGAETELADLLGAKRTLFVRRLSQETTRELAVDESAEVVTLVAGQPDPDAIKAGLARLYCAGVDIDWEAWFEADKRQKISLPVYPFEKKRYWIGED